jgi:hypothetical protein
MRPHPGADFAVRDIVVPGIRIAYRPMNFGQPIAGQVPIPWTMRLPVGEFCARMAQDYRRWITEMQDDLAKWGIDNEEDLDARLLRVGWPSLEALLRDHPDLGAEFLKDCLRTEILDIYTGATLTDYDYLINSFDRVLPGSDDIVFAGTCYELSAPGPIPG